MPSSRGPRIGIFGGTFDPIHIGHLVAANEIRHVLELERVLFVPAGRPPHKTEREITPDADRLHMLQLALAGNPAFDISTVDFDRGGLSYTADMLALLAAELAPASLVFIMGEDSLRDLPSWHQPRRIASLAELGVAARPNVNFDLDAVLEAVPEARSRVHVVPIPLIGISSTTLRQRVGQGKPIDYLVPPGIARYVRDCGLYRALDDTPVAEST